MSFVGDTTGFGGDSEFGNDGPASNGVSGYGGDSSEFGESPSSGIDSRGGGDGKDNAAIQYYDKDGNPVTIPAGQSASQSAASIQKDATVQAAELQAQTAREQLEANERAISTARSDLQPFREAGVSSIQGLTEANQRITGLSTDQNQQAEFVQNNPFFKALADDAQRRLFNNQAAKGKVGSGGTAEALQNSVLLLGNDLLDKGIQREQGVFNNNLDVTSLGSNAAAGQANQTRAGANTGANIATNSTAAITDLITQGANAQAAGIVGDANASAVKKQNTTNTILGLASIWALSDEREKENVTFVGAVRGIPYYFFNYLSDKKTQFGTMAQKVAHIKGAVLDMGGKKYVNYGVLNAN